MSMPIVNNNAIYGAKNSASQPLPRANFLSPATGYFHKQPANLFASASLGLKRDQVSFQGKNDTTETSAREILQPGLPKPGEPELAHSTDRRNANPNQTAHPLGYYQNNARELARIALCDIAPVALSIMPILGLPGVGVVFALASLPLSYYLGKLGRKIAKNVEPQNLHPAFQYIHKVKQALTTSCNGNPDNLVNAINEAGDVFANQKLFSSILPKLKVQSGGTVAKILTRINRMAVLRIEVNNRLAQAKNGKEARKAIIDGTKNAGFYIAMSEIGTALTASSFPGAKIVGELMKNAGMLNILVDVLHDKKTRSG